jgi:hypothetical protein
MATLEWRNLWRIGMSRTDADVATVLALEEPAKALLEAIKAAQPAIERLYAAKYAGAGWVGDQLRAAVADDEGLGTVALVASAVEMLRAADGDQGAFDHAFYVGYLGQTLHGATETIMGEVGLGQATPRIQAMRQYAAR